MGARWKLAGFHLWKVLCVVLIIHLFTDECFSINLEGMCVCYFLDSLGVCRPGDSGNVLKEER